MIWFVYTQTTIIVVLFRRLSLKRHIAVGTGFEPVKRGERLLGYKSSTLNLSVNPPQ